MIIEFFLLNLLLFKSVICQASFFSSHDAITNTLIAKKLKVSFLASNVNLTSYDKFKQSLLEFQSNLIKLRNNECFLQSKIDPKLNDLFTSSNDTKWLATLDLMHNFSIHSADSVLADNIVFNLNQMCISSNSLLDLFYVNDSQASVWSQNYENLFQIVLTQLTNQGCDLCNESEKKNDKTSVTKLETWGYGVLFVTIISASSICGAFVIPFSNKKFYKKLLMFLIGIAVGSLAGSGFLHLIPQAYEITDDLTYSLNHMYVWKGLFMMFGVYLFYLVERIMKIMIYKRKLKKNTTKNTNETKQHGLANNQQILESIGYVKTHEPNVEPNVEMRLRLDEKAMAEIAETKNNKMENRHGHSHGFENIHSVAPVAWMIIFGDGLHNFIDGLSIGAAFTESVLKGISICLAVICEEFPHELGDFAILINSGMSYPVALFFNFLSACCCYIGLAVGIVMGENLGINSWIYAIAGGMFLYISLCDMVPELNEIGEEIERDYMIEQQKFNQLNLLEEEKNLNGSNTTNDQNIMIDIRVKVKVLIIQNIGIIIGFSFMLVMAIYSENIKL